MFKQDLLIVFSDAFIFLGLLGAACLSASFMCFMNNYLAIFNIHLEFYKTGLFAAFWIHSYFFFQDYYEEHSFTSALQFKDVFRRFTVKYFRTVTFYCSEVYYLLLTGKVCSVYYFIMNLYLNSLFLCVNLTVSRFMCVSQNKVHSASL